WSGPRHDNDLAIQEFEFYRVTRRQFAELVARHRKEDQQPVGSWLRFCSQLRRPDYLSSHSAALLPALLGSMHAPAVGSIFAGLQRFSGWNADPSRIIIPRSSGENSWGMKLIFSTPMPCSPVTLPPTRMHSSKISWLAARTRFTWSASRSSKSRMGWMLPSPAWKMLQMRSWCLPLMRWISRRMCGNLLRGTTPSWVQ